MSWIVAFSIGAGLGLVCVGGLWLTVRRTITMPARRTSAIISQIARLALAALVFVALRRNGMAAILPALAGFWIARWHLIRRLGVTADGR